MYEAGYWAALAALGAAAGVGLGMGFFGGLWWTVKRLPACRRPRRLLAVSALLRLGAVLFGFWLLVRVHWLLLAASLGGFLLARRLWIAWRGAAPRAPACAVVGGRR